LKCGSSLPSCLFWQLCSQCSDFEGAKNQEKKERKKKERRKEGKKERRKVKEKL
jgi:hypothetical protein